MKFQFQFIALKAELTSTISIPSNVLVHAPEETGLFGALETASSVDRFPLQANWWLSRSGRILPLVCARMNLSKVSISVTKVEASFS